MRAGRFGVCALLRQREGSPFLGDRVGRRGRRRMPFQVHGEKRFLHVAPSRDSDHPARFVERELTGVPRHPLPVHQGADWIHVHRHSTAIPAGVVVVVAADRRLGRRAVHRAQPGRDVQVAARLVEVDVHLGVRAQSEHDAFEVEQVGGVVDVEQRFEREVEQQQIGAARRGGTRQARRLARLLVRQMPS